MMTNEQHNKHLGTSFLNRNLVLFQGAKKYPELSELVPSRPPDAEDCSHCNGTGIEPMNEKPGLDEERIVCYCGGLGWLPK